MSQPREIFVQVDKCVACFSCELACAVEHSIGKSLYAAVSEAPAPRKRLYVEAARERNVPLLCRHCEDAPCARACVTGAITQDPLTRLVTQDPEKCIGCWMCSMVCRYGVIGRMKERRVAVKCDLCPERDSPACVDACPTAALIFTDEEHFSKSVRSSAASQLAESVAQPG